MVFTRDAMKVNGQKIRMRRKAIGKSQQGLAHDADINEKTIREYERGVGSFPQASTLQGLVKGLQIGLQQFWNDYVIYEEGEFPPVVAEEVITPLPNDIAIPRVDYLAIPEWPKLKIAASHWVTMFEVGEVVGDALIRQALKARRFRVCVAGDCLSDRWPDAALVEFVLLDEHDEMIVGQDYYIQTEEGATFKRLYEISEEEIVVGCKDGNLIWSVPRTAIQRMAKAVGMFAVPSGVQR